MKRTMFTRLTIVFILTVLCVTTGALAQVRHEIQIPDILGYKTLKCDLHMHTVFSDGLVWPTVRVDEAWREGFDVISITDHIEYQPHKDDVPTNHNRPYDIALSRAKARGILLIRGTEITRQTPPGHFNAIFLSDVNPLDTKDLLDAMAAAKEQGAYIWWNHPGWKPDREGWFDIHTTLYDNGYMNGIEVVNGGSYYPLAHKWAMERGLTFMANSDIHQPSLRETTTPENHRSMTLVFAEAKTEAAVKEAFLKGRTAIWYKDRIIGRQPYVEALFNASVQMTGFEYAGPDVVCVEVENGSDVPVMLTRAGKLGPASVTLDPHTMARVRTKVGRGEGDAVFEYTVDNFLVAPGQGLPVHLSIPRPKAIKMEVSM